MKKLAMFLVMMVVCGAVFAGGSKPVKGSYEECNYNAEQLGRKAGAKPAYEGGDNAKWYAATHAAYNECQCRFFGRPYPNGVDTCK